MAPELSDAQIRQIVRDQVKQMFSGTSELAERGKKKTTTKSRRRNKSKRKLRTLKRK